MGQGTDINTIQHDFETPFLVDEVSSTEFYIGYSNNSSNRSAAHWRIKRIIQISSVWNFEFPDGNQNFVFVWDDRDTYDYHA